jgi:hypothetical protein
MKEIPLTQGKFALVDDEDFEWLSQWRWHFDHKGYAIRDTQEHTIYMHRLIANIPEGLFTDHINGNGLDNRRKNLRPCNTAQNSANQRIRKDNTSGYKGVTWDTERKIWAAQCHTVGRKHIFLGRFENIEDAARAYDKKAIELHGEFARTNFNNPNFSEEDINAIFSETDQDFG